jgi:transposase
VIQITPQMRVFVAVEPADFRKGIDGLARIARIELKSDPFSGTAFLFRNRRGNAVKVLVYDGQGFWLCHKRLSSGRFRHWPQDQAGAEAMEAQAAQVLLWAGDFKAARTAPAWRRVHPKNNPETFNSSS